METMTPAALSVYNKHDQKKKKKRKRNENTCPLWPSGLCGVHVHVKLNPT